MFPFDVEYIVSPAQFCADNNCGMIKKMLTDFFSILVVDLAFIAIAIKMRNFREIFQTIFCNKQQLVSRCLVFIQFCVTILRILNYWIRIKT